MAININFACEIILILLVIFTVVSLLTNSLRLNESFDVITEIFNTWKAKPIDSIQISKYRSCSELRMKDLVKYKWTGNSEGCSCKNEVRETCSNEDLQSGACVKILSSTPQILNKWKGNYICGSIIKNKNYFELTKSENSKCYQRHKFCGTLDTLNNFLCTPDTEQCPVNKIYIRKPSDENNFNIESGNNVQDGKIITGLSITEGPPCFIPSENVLSITSNKLVDESNLTNVFYDLSLQIIEKNKNNSGANNIEQAYKEHIKLQCANSFYNEKKNIMENIQTTSITELDETLLTDFYRVNKLDIYKVSPIIPLKLYSKIYRGWKKECETNQFFAFFKSTNNKEEVTIIIDIIIKSSGLLTIISFVLIICIGGSLACKHYGLFKESFATGFLAFQLPVIVSSILLFIISGEIGSQIKQSPMISTFFEMINTRSCSDEITDNELKSVSKDYFDLNDKYFNLKIFSIIIAVLVIIVYVVPLKNKYEKSKKKSTFDYQNKIL